MGIAILRTRSIPTRRVWPASVMTQPDLRLCLVERMTPWYRKGAAEPKPCLSPVEICTLTAAGSLLPAGIASSATRNNFHQPPLCFCPTEEINSRTSTQYATTYSSLWKMKVLQTRTRQTLVFDPGGSTGRLRACLFLGAWRMFV